MRNCPKCGTMLHEQINSCPVCNYIFENDPCYSLYPSPIRRRNLRSLLPSWLPRTLFDVIVICAIINLCVGGIPWFLYIATSVFVFYQAFLSWELIENTFIQKMMSLSRAIIIELLIIQQLSGPHTWATQMVIPLILSASLLISAIVFAYDFRRQRANILSIASVALSALIAFIVSLFGPGGTPWPFILCAYTVALILWIFLFYRKSIRVELRKHFHL